MGIISFLQNIRLPMRRMAFQEAEQRIAEKAYTWKPDPRAEVHWAVHARMKHPPGLLVTRLLAEFDLEGVQIGSAIDLGCGSGIHTLDLLSRRWDVTAIDSNKTALAILEKRVQDLRRACYQSDRPLQMGKLTPIQSPMENCIFPSDVDLVIAMHSLSYCNPAKMLTVWNRAHEALRPGGRIVASFARAPLLPLSSPGVSAWHTEPAIVDALLREKGYKVEFFSDGGRLLLSTGNLMVIAKKV
ncbi:MAG: class I SAM-dependent methyltransferase [Chlamydiota bacterium]